MSATPRSVLSRLAARLALALVAFTLAAPGFGADTAETVVLVAKPEIVDPLYSATILVAKSMSDGRHLGFILNKPTNVSLAKAFPDHAPSRSVREPLYLGGPDVTDAVFALVQRHDSPGTGSMQFAPDVFLATAEDTVNKIIEFDAGHARFFVGVVMWQPGELDAELKLGAWYVLDARPELVLPEKTEGLWEELVRRAEQPFDRAAEHVQPEHVEKDVRHAAVQEAVGDELPGRETRREARARRGGPKRKGGDERESAELQQKNRHVGDDQRSGNRKHPLS